MSYAQILRLRRIAQQNRLLRLCLVLSVLLHLGIGAAALRWQRDRPSQSANSESQPIEVIVVDPPEAKTAPDTDRIANRNSQAGGEFDPNRPIEPNRSRSASTSAQSTSSSSSRAGGSGTVARTSERTPASSNSAGRSPQTASQNTLDTSRSETPTSQPQTPAATPSTARSTPSPESTASASSQSENTQSRSTPSRSTSTSSGSSNGVSTSAADLLGSSGDSSLVAQRSPQLFNANQSASGTLGIDARQNDVWGPYYASIQRAIVARWNRISIDRNRQVKVRFTINRQGGLQNAQLIQPSGFQDADQAALRAVQAAAPFPPLPAEATLDYLTVTFTFNYTPR